MGTTKDLTEKQRRFCNAYMANGGDASAAYRDAYDTSRMKPVTVNRKAHELKSLGKITATIDLLRDEENERLKDKYRVDNDRVMTELVRIGFSDVTELFDEQGYLREINSLPQDLRLAISEITIQERIDGEVLVRTSKVKLLDKLGALRDIAKMLGMFAVDNQQKAKREDDSVSATVKRDLVELLGRMYPAPPTGYEEKEKPTIQ